MKQYVKIHIWDYLFTFLISFGLALNIFASFVISEELTSNYFLAIPIVAIINVVLFVIGYNKKTTLLGSIFGTVTLVIALVLLFGGGYLAEGDSVSETAPLFVLVLVLTTVFTYLFTRVRKLALPFAVASMFVCAVFSFLQYPVSTFGLIVMLVGLGLETLYRNYYEALNEASYGTFDFNHFTVQSTIIVLLVCVLSSVVYYGVIAPMNPVTKDLKLITEYMAWDTVDKKGVSSSTETESDDLTSNKLNDTQHKTNLKDESESDKSKEESDSDDAESKNDDMSKKSQNSQTAFSVSYEENTVTIILIILAILIAIASPFVTRYLLRKRRRNKIEQMSPQDGIRYLYKYFLKKYRLVNLEKASNATVLEYARQNASVLQTFDTASGTTFAKLSDIYNRMIYGAYSPTEEDYALYKDFYDSFAGGIKRRMGTPKYIFKFWFV